MATIARFKKPVSKIKSWSFSRYDVYKSCPRKAKYKFLDKLPEPGSDAMDRGSALHKMAEEYIKGTGRCVPADLKLVGDTLKNLRKKFTNERGTILVEDNWGFGSDWNHVDYFDWNNCVSRIKLDCVYSEGTAITVIDWKTGKFNQYKIASYIEQMQLYGLAALLKFPQAEAVTPQLHYIDYGIVYPRKEDPEIVYTRDDEKKLIKVWNAKVEPMLNDTEFKPTPGDACRFCHYKKSNGGPCEF
jgi:CRISPR/Cas system-associated exonuclease Cas4 (RecB family)